MRRKDREITDFADIVDILRRCDTVRLGIHGGEYPYIVPLSFGFSQENGVLTLYVHGAKKGCKHTLLAQNSKVCVEADLLHRYTQKGQDIFAEYESVIGCGIAEQVHGDEAHKGLDLLLEHCGYAGFSYPDGALQALTIYKITLHSVTGKRCTV